MNNTRIKLISILSIVFVLSYFGVSQDSSINELRYEVNRIYPAITITKAKLNSANTIGDFKNESNNLNLDYNHSWVRKYISVEISIIYKGNIRKAVTNSEILSQEQKDIMNMVDPGTSISVKVKYIPENTLTHNDPKELDFTFTVDPENEAIYTGGSVQMMKYLKERAIDEIPDNSFKNYDLTAIKFTINENGEIIDAHLFGQDYLASKNENIDNLLLETVRNMPCWKPAEYANGTKVKQDFVLTVGNMDNCMTNLLNIRRE